MGSVLIQVVNVRAAQYREVVSSTAASVALTLVRRGAQAAQVAVDVDTRTASRYLNPHQNGYRRSVLTPVRL
jgi:hypothetical protein